MDGTKKTTQSKQKRKRSPAANNAFNSAYSQISFQALPDPGRLGSPHRFFSSSYVACISTATPDVDPSSDQSLEGTKQPQTEPAIAQVVHYLSNGLCIVTVGDQFPSSNVQSLEFVMSSDMVVDCSAAEKRKRQAKMLRGSHVPQAVSPRSILAHLHMENGDKIPLVACVWGMILELNLDLELDILKKDPLLDGYLAVILPAGSFPPIKSSLVLSSHQAQDEESHSANES